MKIREIKAFPLGYPEPHYNGMIRYITLARVETDDGLVGWGECISQFLESSLATKAIIEQGYAPLLVGEDPRDVERLYEKMQARIWWYGPQGIAAYAVSAVDMALWDLKGKALGMPVCNLIGGQLHDKVGAMASIIWNVEDIDWCVSEFKYMKEQGYQVVKGGWGMRPEAVFGMDRKRDLELVRRVREVIGDDLELVVDMPGNRGIWDAKTAIRRVNELEQFRLKWMEEPLPYRDLDAHVRLRAAVTTPIGAGEGGWIVDDYQRLIRSGGVDIVQMDPGKVHGITGCRHVIKLIEAENLQWSAHTWSSALNTAASLHLLASSTHGVNMDFKPHESPMQHELVNDPWVPKDGFLDVRDTPGLGVTVREEIVQKYTVE